MEVGGVLLKNERVSSTSEVLDSLWSQNSPPSFHGSPSMVSFEEVRGEIDSKCNPPEKKRRLSTNQVQFLEKSFEVENKLEPERKEKLAKELGLQPRQVAIWFQNRRARYKTKVLEKEYDSLKASYDKLKSDYDTLFKENEKMKNEVNLMTEKTEKEITVSAKSDVLDSSMEAANSSHVVESDFSQDEDDENLSLLPAMCNFPKIEIESWDYDDGLELHPNSCNLGFPVQDQGTWFWQY